MIKFYYFLIFAFSLSANILNGQTTYFSVKKTKSNTTKFDEGAKLTKFNLEKACLKNAFISVVDRDLVNVAEKERALQKNESFMDGSYVEQDKAIGASIVIISEYDSDDQSLLVDLIDIETNELIYRENYNLKPFVTKNHQIEREAYYGRYIEELMENILVKINISSELSIEVANISEADKGKAKTLLIYCPEECHLAPGEKLEIYKEVVIENLDITDKIVVGLVEVTYVENSKICNAKVKDGAKTILADFNAQTKLKCRYASK